GSCARSYSPCNLRRTSIASRLLTAGLVAAAGSVDPGALLQLRRVHGGPGAPHLPRRRRPPVRLRGGLRRRRRGPHQQLALLLLLAAEPGEAQLAQAPLRRALLPRGHKEL